MEDLYIVEQVCKIRKKNSEFIIYKNNTKLTAVPIHNVNNIMIFGNQSISTQVISAALENNIDIMFLNMNGLLKGKLSGTFSKNVFIRLIQYDMWRNSEKKLLIAKSIVKGKIKNQNLLLKRYGIKLNNLKSFTFKIDSVSNVNELMGIEGICSRNYFIELKKILPEQFEFNGRNRRPPKDEVNALLSLTYTMTLNRITSAIDCTAFDGYMGFLHSIKYGRESLALDIIEEFRQSFCDPFVIKLLNRKEIKKSDFLKDGEKVILSEKAFRKFLNKFNAAAETLNENIKQQLEILKESLLEDKEYKPIKYKW